MDTVQILAPAKINRTLQILDILPEKSLHALSSEVCAISLCDILTVTKTPEKKIRISVGGPFSAGVPNNHSNTLYKMASAFFAKEGFSFGIDIHLEKNIPPKSGLGGGSSDAAALLRVLSHFSGKPLSLSPEEICSVGSDIPFFLQENPVALLEGCGERIEKTKLPPPEELGVLVFPEKISIETAWAYRELDEFRKQGVGLPTPKNDFESVLFPHFPDLQKIVEKLHELGASECGMTGSGSALFGLFSNAELQKTALENFPKSCPFSPINSFPQTEEI